MRKLLKSFLFLSIIMACLSSCGGSGSDTPDPGSTFDRAAMFNYIGKDIIIPSYTNFHTAISDLKQKAEDFTTAPSDVKLSALQGSLKDAYIKWQNCNIVEFGPAEKVLLKGSVNTFPTNVDNIETNISTGSYNLDAAVNISSVGLPAIDYLINAEDAEVIVNQFANSVNRAQYLTDLTSTLEAKITAVVDDWSEANGNYLGTFATATGSDVGSALGMTVNALNSHYERFMRDGKIGIPVGIRSVGVARPFATEAYYGGYSKELAVVNMKAIQQYYLGTGLNGQSGIGFEEFLKDIERSQLDTDIKSQINVILNALNSLSDPLSENIMNDQSSVEAVYPELQKLAVLFKTDMPSAMGVSITYQDNDGD